MRFLFPGAYMIRVREHSVRADESVGISANIWSRPTILRSFRVRCERELPTVRLSRLTRWCTASRQVVLAAMCGIMRRFRRTIRKGCPKYSV